MAGEKSVCGYKLNPGSKEALDQGCSCPVLDNHRGAGVPWPREDGLDPNEHPSFWINAECPLHGGMVDDD